MPYFYDCTTKEEARTKYKELAKKLHPDKGGNAKEFKHMQAEYDRFDEPQFRFNTIKDNPKDWTNEDIDSNKYYQGFGAKFNQGFYDDINRGFNPFRQYTQSTGRIYTENDVNYLKEQLGKKHDYIYKLNIKLCNMDERFMKLYEEYICLTNHNSELDKANAMQARYIEELKDHWLIGRLLKWFKMYVEFVP